MELEDTVQVTARGAAAARGPQHRSVDAAERGAGPGRADGRGAQATEGRSGREPPGLCSRWACRRPGDRGTDPQRGLRRRRCPRTRHRRSRPGFHRPPRPGSRERVSGARGRSAVQAHTQAPQSWTRRSGPHHCGRPPRDPACVLEIMSLLRGMLDPCDLETTC